MTAVPNTHMVPIVMISPVPTPIWVGCISTWGKKMSDMFPKIFKRFPRHVHDPAESQCKSNAKPTLYSNWMDIFRIVPQNLDVCNKSTSQRSGTKADQNQPHHWRICGKELKIKDTTRNISAIKRWKTSRLLLYIMLGCVLTKCFQQW